ncbi:hypothetical protein QYF36_008336 [Acer negundo]|nr:hypothetical protein QYF36_008336 [Acer negundo]
MEVRWSRKTRNGNVKKCNCTKFNELNHIGKLDAGHYVTYLRLSNQWYKCDDTWITQANKNVVRAVQGYMMFYVQKMVYYKATRSDRLGAVCQDPRFISGDGITFYFHVKKDKDFCLVSNSNLHTWDDSIDRLTLSFNKELITLLKTYGSNWQSKNISITRVSETNNVSVEVRGKFKITTHVVPIIEQDSRVHNYDITREDCFTLLYLGFKFYSLSNKVNSVLGQTYKNDYMTCVNMGANMIMIGGEKDFQTFGMFAADYTVALRVFRIFQV